MKVAVVGGGFTGLACMASLVGDKSLEVVLFEESRILGGIAKGFKNNNWDWYLEDYYHHIFKGDQDIQHLAQLVGSPAKFFSPVTSSWVDGKEIRLDSPISVLKFSPLPLVSRVQMGIGLALLKFLPSGVFLEKYKVVDMLPKLIGRKAYEKIWERLLVAKFGKKHTKVNMAWFWTRVAKRSKQLGYFDGGFQVLVNSIEKYIVENGGVIRAGKEVKNIRKSGNKIVIDSEEFDKVVFTTPAPITNKIYISRVKNDLDYLWGQTLILESKKKIVSSYWLNILEKNWPFLVLVEHTNMISKSHYGNKEILYLGNYLEDGDKQLEMPEERLLEKYLPYLQKIRPDIKRDDLRIVKLARTRYAQPVFPLNYSQMIPSTFSVDNIIYEANMSMVYPFDRGTNYAVKMGVEVAKIILSDIRLKNV